jgi:hypothetical protein
MLLLQCKLTSSALAVRARFPPQQLLLAKPLRSRTQQAYNRQQSVSVWAQVRDCDLWLEQAAGVDDIEAFSRQR